MRFRRIETYLILGCYLGIGALLGYSIGKDKPQWNPIKKPHTVTVDILKEDEEILIYEHSSYRTAPVARETHIIFPLRLCGSSVHW